MPKATRGRRAHTVHNLHHHIDHQPTVTVDERNQAFVLTATQLTVPAHG